MSVDAAANPTPVEVSEIRLLEGPNLYFTRPAVKVSLLVPGYLDLPGVALAALAGQLRVRRSTTGEPGSASRQHFVVLLIERIVRAMARGGGTVRLGVRVRPGTRPDEVVVAFPWNSRERGAAMAAALGPALTELLTVAPQEAPEVLRAAGERLVGVGGTRRERMRAPTVPVIAITGTNGKTTTTRLVAHIAMTAGLVTGWSSTDGVLVQGTLLERGDYSGPAGARAVLGAPGVQVAVLETARGGMLLKGLGTPYNDVSVVTNVSADHLGQNGIDTLDQLAEVKAIVTKVTRPQGWVVLNGDDPRVWAMRTSAGGGPWCFSLDPDSPSLRESLQEGGRGVTVLDGDVVLLYAGRGPEHVIAVDDIPMTLAGLSRHNIANALAGTAAAAGIGLETTKIAEGLRTFAPDYRHNPGRMNIYTVPVGTGAATVVLDMAHNEGGLQALLDVAVGLRAGHARVVLGLGTGGDRSDEILVNLGEMAGLRADLVHIVHKEHYLRGRSMDDLAALFQVGLARAGVEPVGVWGAELPGLEALVEQAQDGDVLPLMVHSDRAVLHDWLIAHGASVDDPATIRAKVQLARATRATADVVGVPHLQQRLGAAVRLLRAGRTDQALAVLEPLVIDQS